MANVSFAEKGGGGGGFLPAEGALIEHPTPEEKGHRWRFHQALTLYMELFSVKNGGRPLAKSKKGYI
jgi:hypothetical protein